MEIKPEIFGKYILLDKIATGGMAEIYLAKAPGAENVSKFVAIKRILPQYCNNHEFIEMFKEEAKIAINLSHANVVSIIEFGIESSLFFLAMQYVDGKNLRQILNRLKKDKKYFSLPQIIYVIKEAAKGLDHAHRCVDNTTGTPLNITHRDISPQNIMLSYDGEIKIIDFGIAKAESKIETTRAGTLKGKFGYMSPEQAEGFEVDFRTDIFSLGIVLWELLAQDRLFVSNNEINTLKKIRECHIPSLRKLDPNIPQELERITMKALARDRTLRYQSAEEMAQDLQIFLNKHFHDFTYRDLSHTLKTIFADERETSRQKMIGYAKIQFQKEEKTEYVERTTTVTEPHGDIPEDTTSHRSSTQTSSRQDVKLDISDKKVDQFNIDFDRQDLVSSSSRRGTQKYNTKKTKANTKITNVHPTYNTNTTFPYSQTESVVIKHQPSMMKYIVMIAIVCGFGYYAYQNPDLQQKILDRTRDFVGTKSISSEDPKGIAKDLAKDLPTSLLPYYNLLVTSIPSGASIYVEDKATGVLTPGQIRVPANKSFQLRLEKEGYYVESKQMLTAKQGDEVRVTLRKILPAYLNITVSGGTASIFVNGKKVSDHAPVIKYPVAANVSIKVQAYNAQTGRYVEKILEVRPNSTTQVHLNLFESRTPSAQ